MSISTKRCKEIEAIKCMDIDAEKRGDSAARIARKAAPGLFMEHYL